MEKKRPEEVLKIFDKITRIYTVKILYGQMVLADTKNILSGTALMVLS